MKNGIKAAVFDLDGTLYFNDLLGKEIGRVSASYISRIKGIDPAAARELIRATRKRLTVENGYEASLSIACLALGGDLQELHNCFAAEIAPEPLLERDDRVVALLAELARRFPIYVYTNNNRLLSSRIMDTLGVSRLFDRVFTIEDGWRPKPDLDVLVSIMSEIGRNPSECLFVGDRYDIDLRLPEEMGATVHLVGSMEDLLALNKFIQ